MKKPMNYYLPIISHYLDVPYDDKPRRVRVLLPRDYDMYVEETYPVVYMHDGQNVFYSKEAYSGHSWKLIPLIKNYYIYIQLIHQNREFLSFQRSKKMAMVLRLFFL